MVVLSFSYRSLSSQALPVASKPLCFKAALISEASNFDVSPRSRISSVLRIVVASTYIGYSIMIFEPNVFSNYPENVELGCWWR